MFVSLAGCAGPPPKTPAPATASAPEVAKKPKVDPERAAQKDAQRAWCGYLEALYLRADKAATNWPRFVQCTDVVTKASAKMLKKTAECSLAALEGFPGDPFTPEYALAVRACGAEALDAMRASGEELAPYVATICGRIGRCGSLDDEKCRETLEQGLGDHLERAIGAMSTDGRAELAACLQSVTCSEIGDQIHACIEPLMDQLLWLPG